MKYQISRFSILQMAKVTAILYGVISLIIVPFGCLILVLNPQDQTSIIVGILYLFFPIINAIIGFIFGVIGFWIYNLVAPRIGGFEFELKELPPSSP